MAGWEHGQLSRRELLRFGAMGAAGSVLGLLHQAALAQGRAPTPVPARLPDIQHDIGGFLAPVQTIDGVAFRFGPVFTRFVPARLTRTPEVNDQSVLSDALDRIESTYRFAPDGAFTFVAYGIPYFRVLPPALVVEHVPRLRDQPSRFCLEEAVPSPTDVSRVNPSVKKRKFNVPVMIERSDLLFTIRSDSLRIASDIEAWLTGSNVLADRAVASPRFAGLLRFDPGRVMFSQRGMPRRVAEGARLRFADRIHPQSPMWMGFADQQVAGAGPAEITTFQGNSSARLTTATPGDYFSNGAIQHLSHVILDLEQFYLAAGSNERRDETYLQRVQYMFRSTPPPSRGNVDQITDGGGPAFLPNEFKGVDDAVRGAAGIGTLDSEHRLGHLAALQRSSRAPDRTPMHIRMDGPGFDALDVPDGSNQPKLQFSIFVPTAEFFARMRRNQASVDLARQHDVADDDQGLERFLTATRRQNFLVPPRAHRALPLVELVEQRFV